MLILTTFGLSDPLERVMKIIIKVCLCISAVSSCSDFVPVMVMIGLSGAEEGKKSTIKGSFGPFLISSPPSLSQKVIKRKPPVM